MIEKHKQFFQRLVNLFAEYDATCYNPGERWQDAEISLDAVDYELKEIGYLFIDDNNEAMQLVIEDSNGVEYTFKGEQ